MSADERLAHHRARSGPVMDDLYAWIDEQFKARRDEPNSGLGSATRDLVTHRAGLTTFLSDGRAQLPDGHGRPVTSTRVVGSVYRLYRAGLRHVAETPSPITRAFRSNTAKPEARDLQNS